MGDELVRRYYGSSVASSLTLRVRQAAVAFQEGDLPKAALLMEGLLRGEYRDDIDVARLEQEALEDDHRDKEERPLEPLKRIRKKKKKPRYPKGFNPDHPGPLPDPERWLPKCERKKYRKKENLKSGKTQGAASGKEQMNLFQGAGQTRNKGKGRKKD